TSAWQTWDLNAAPPPVADGRTLLVVSNVLNELTPTGRDHLAALVRALPEASLAVVIEPGDRERTRALNAWRRDLVRDHAALTPLLPCGQEFGHEQPQACGTCWNARREHLHPTPLYRVFRECAAARQADCRSLDTFENDLLSWSYAVVLRGELPCVLR